MNEEQPQKILISMLILTENGKLLIGEIKQKVKPCKIFPCINSIIVRMQND